MNAWVLPEDSQSDEWRHWLHHLSVQLLRASPLHCLRACASLAEVHEPLAHDLFHTAFTSCWSQLPEEMMVCGLLSA
jgi:FKBP12-rapamycin complex-associated protein